MVKILDMEWISDLLSFTLFKIPGQNIKVTLGSVVVLLLAWLITSLTLKIIKRVLRRKVADQNIPRFNIIFSFSKYFIFLIVFMLVLDSVGISITAILVGSTALFVGLGFGLQKLFEDIVSGIFIMVDKSISANDIVQINDKVGRVTEIKLRTTRALTIDNKVLIIPNHKFLEEILYNWTQNGTLTREWVKIRVALDSDVPLVKKLLLKIAEENEKVLDDPEPLVIFEDFGEDALHFKIIFTLNDSFKARDPQSEIRFAIDREFRKHNIEIPVPKRDVRLYEKTKN